MACWVTISFESQHPMAMMLDWSSELGLVDPTKMRRLQVKELTVDVANADDAQAAVERARDDT